MPIMGIPFSWAEVSSTPVFKVVPAGSDGKESACSARYLGSLPGLG